MKLIKNTDEYEISEKDIAEQFSQSRFDEADFESVQPLEVRIRLFIQSKDGLNSTLPDAFTDARDVSAIERAYHKLKKA